MDIETTSTGFRQSRFGERYLPELHRRLFETAPSATVFARMLSCDLDAEDTLFVIVGSDSGLLLEHLTRHTLGKGSRGLVIESDELYPLIAPLATSVDETITLCGEADWESALRACEPSRYLYGGRIELVESLGCVHDHTGVYVPILRRARTALGRMTHRHAIEVSGKEFILKQMANACENACPASRLKGIGTGRTAVVLGGGPSLDESVDWIFAHRESIFVFAASRLCSKLRRLGLKPDVVVAIDPQPGMYEISREGLLWTDVPLVGSFHLAPQLAHQWRGPRLYLGELHPWEGRADGTESNIASQGPTVVHAAVWLAHSWGFDRILMSGVDMCHAIGGGSHAEGNAESVLDSLPFSYDAVVKTYNGLSAGTPRALQHGLERLEEIGRRINSDGQRLFNTSENAARVASIPLLDLRNIEPDGPRPRMDLVDDVPRRVEHLHRVRREQADAARRFGAIDRRCRDARQLLDGMGRATSESGIQAQRRKLGRLEKGLRKDHGPWFDVIRRYAAAELLSGVKPGGFSEADATERQDWGRDYYRVIGRTARALSEVLKECDVRTTMRMAELEDDPDTNALLAYWDEDGTPGRALSLRERLARVAPSAGTERLDECARAFFLTLERTETVHADMVRSGLMAPPVILRNLLFLFREGMTVELMRVAGGLHELAPPHDVFAGYASGLLAELDGNVAASLDAYQGVIDRFGDWQEREENGVPEGFDILLEETLQRITQCYLKRGEGEAAAGSLCLLARISPAYVSQHAHLLHLLGRHEEALQALENHVQGDPGDWKALLQMAEICTALGATEAADEMRRLAEATREAVPLDRAA